MAGNVADYSIVLDGNVTVVDGAHDTEIRTFGVPGRYIDQSCIIGFMIRAASNNARLGISINDKEVFIQNLTSTGIDRMFQEVFAAKIVHDGSNTLRLTAHRGQCTVSDIVVWYQRTT